uniref:Uncharacterized protein n=1 Tax=Arundo donax TaxID=35708 RepID=A0A0A9AQR1_ARUDO
MCCLVQGHRTTIGVERHLSGTSRAVTLKEYSHLQMATEGIQEAAWCYLITMGGHYPQNGRMQRGGSSVPTPAMHWGGQSRNYGDQSPKVDLLDLLEILVDRTQLLHHRLCSLTVVESEITR